MRTSCRLGRTVRRRLGPVLLATVVLVAPVSADVIVLGSSTSAIKTGTVLTADKTIEVPAGARVRVMLPSGRTQEFKGPAHVKVGDLGKGETVNESLWNDVKRLVANQKTASESHVGAVRSVAPKSTSADRGAATTAASAAAPAFSWRLVPIDNGGDICIEKGVPIEMLRSKPGRPQAVSVVNMQSKAKAASEFAVGSVRAPWPAGVGTDVGLYTVVLADGGKRDIRLRPIAPLPAADETLRVLHGQRCLGQIEAWLRGQMTASR